MAQHHAGVAVEARQAADDAEVVGVVPVAVQFLEVGEDLVDVVQRVGALRMAGDLRHLPGRQVRVDVLGELHALAGQPFDLVGDVDCGFVLHVAQFVDLGFEFSDRLLELQEMSFAHQYSTGSGSRLRQIYQVATERNGAQASPTSRASARDTGSPLK